MNFEFSLKKFFFFVFFRQLHDNRDEWIFAIIESDVDLESFLALSRQTYGILLVHPESSSISAKHTFKRNFKVILPF